MPSDLFWVLAAADVHALQFRNGIAAVEVSGKNICVGKNKDGYYAFAAKCPHAGALFRDGFVDALGNVVCPLHKYRFCMRTGRNVSGEGYLLKRWPVKLQADGLYVGLPQLGLY